MDAIKGAILSKTMWVNGIVTIAGLLDMVLSYSGIITAVAPQLAPWITILGAANMFLRTITSTGLSEKGAATEVAKDSYTNGQP